MQDSPSLVTPPEEPPRRDPMRLMAGVAIIAFGVLLLLGRTIQPGWLERTGWWPLFAIAFGILQCANPRKLSSGVAFVLFGVWGLCNELGTLHYESSWPLLFVIMGVSLVLGSIAQRYLPPATAARHGDLKFVTSIVLFAMVFGGAQALHRTARADNQSTTAGRLRGSAVLGQSRTVSYADPFEGARLTALMGECDVDLTNAVIRSDAVSIVNVAVTMGHGILRLPADWTISNEITPVMGNVDETRHHHGSLAPIESAAPADASSKRVILRGFVTMGELTIVN